ncbi:hypothetical protein C0Q70_00692 [Pomacea canaliculata]|uniref:Spaetzle domain-containing protein n=2 Tax=Pomacea canaliculata TaxID=400727 RepID=A0A2T7PXC1_POMCA|nr:uncharacterized protein LOC112570471 isoform X2 [Pomacea canaliculata]PVD38081.1 hypothetical protein C0Q70_00692 [Pomacea canaliculata]
MDNSSPAFVMNAFPGYFRTPEEQRNYELLTFQPPENTSEVFNVSSKYSACYQDCNTPTANPYPSYRDSFPISNTSSFLGPLQDVLQTSCSIDDLDDQLTFHSCCMSIMSFFAPTELPSGKDSEKTLKIAQFSDAKQYFEKEECCQTEGCTICKCKQASTLVTAVVVEWSPSPKYRVDLVRVPGCCKCVNAD